MKLMTRHATLLICCASAAGCLGDGAASQPKAERIAQTTNIKPPAGTDSYMKAVTAMKAGNDDAAVAELEAALTQNPALQMARMTLGELYIKQQAYAKAVPQFQKATELDPYTLKNFYNLGLSLQVIDRLRESAAAYKRALKLDPQDFRSNMNLGLVYFALGEMDSSIVCLEKATRIEPSNVRAWSNIGVAYDAAGNATLAEASYRKALELDPANESTLVNLTSNLIAQKKAQDAVAIAERLVIVSATPLSRKRHGDALTLAGRWDDAQKAYDSALALDAGFTPALNAKAEALIARYEAELRLDDALRTQAIELWKKSLTLDANQPSVTQLVATWEAPRRFR